MSEKKFKIVSGGAARRTKIFYEGFLIPCVTSVIVSASVEKPILMAEVTLNLCGANCDLEIDQENMIINLGGKRFKLVPKEK